jgi:hypothetical protein
MNHSFHRMPPCGTLHWLHPIASMICRTLEERMDTHCALPRDRNMLRIPTKVVDVSWLGKKGKLHQIRSSNPAYLCPYLWIQDNAAL